MFKKIPNKYYIYIFLVIYLIVNIQTLNAFPNVHSDELWLLGLTNQMIQDKTVFTTEAFYDMYPRVEHPFRWVYHLIYALFIGVFGSNVFTSRFVSLLGGIGALWLFYKWLLTKYNKCFPALVGTIILSLNIQLISSSHTGRQETWILYLLILSVYWIDMKKHGPLSYATIIAVGIGIHPNSFIIGVVASALLFTQWLLKERPLSDLIKLIGFTSIFASFYLIIGFLNTPSFLVDYIKFGSELGVDAAPLSRVEGFYWFFYKLYHQIGGTYDLYDIRFHLILSALTFPLALLGLKNKSVVKTASIMGGVLLALLLIGRYNQTSVLFIMPWSIVIVAEVFKKYHKTAMLMFLIFSCIVLSHNINSYYSEMPYYKPYSKMIDEASVYLDDDSIVLGNLNMIEAGGQNFYDFRNLGYLNGDFESYIVDRSIDTIIFHEEMDYLYKTSPKWDFLYVNIEYMPEMYTFLDEKCELVATLENPIYAMRITKYTGTYPWTTKIYKVKKSE